MIEKIENLVSEVINDKNNDRHHEVVLTAEEFAASGLSEAKWCGAWVEFLEKHIIPKNKSSVQFTPLYEIEAYYDREIGKSVFFPAKKTYSITFEGRELFIYKVSGNLCNISLNGDQRDYYNYSHILSGIGALPNNVGVLTDKKVREWVEWLDKRAAAYDAAIAKENEEVALFLAEVRKIDPSTCHRCDIGEKSGVVERGGIRLSYRIENRHVRTELGLCKRFTYGLESVKEFNRITTR